MFFLDQIHFNFSSVSLEGCVAPRTGFFYNFKKKEVVIKYWDNKLEAIVNNCKQVTV